jgi:hypothetical protein
MKNKVIPYLKLATAYDNYILFVEFIDGVKGEVDLSKWKGNGVFTYWNKEENFKNFKINELNKLEWNEEIDIDPDALYLNLIGKTFDSYASNI